MTHILHCGNSAEVLKQYPDAYFDSVVTDPPYGINFLGKKWDSNTGDLNVYKECFRVLKPGGHILAFSAARTYHHLAITLENAGFEIRDQLMWIYASGFPKAQDIGKSIERREGKRKNATSGGKWKNAEGGKGTNTTTCGTCGKDNVQIGVNFSCQKQGCQMVEKLKPADNEFAGWKTALKPAHEPIVMARKPVEKSIIDNVLKYKTGGLNIDECRIPFEDESDKQKQLQRPVDKTAGIRNYTSNYENVNSSYEEETTPVLSEKGRYPSNVIGEVTGYEKFFYQPKVSRKERHVGYDLDNIPTNPEGKFDRSNDPGNGNERILNKGGNNHPTVKPVELMKYLVRLVTPVNGKVLDPFNGSGSTGMAAVSQGFSYTGIDLSQDYIDISHKRINAYCEPKTDNNFGDLFE